MSTPSPKRKASEKLPDISEILICSESGTPKPLLANAIASLRYDPTWAGVLAYNEFSLFAVTQKPTPWPKVVGSNWTDLDDSLAADWLQHAGILVNSKVASEAVQTVAQENSFHPVRDFLNSLTWDQQPRLEQWLVTYLGGESTPFIRAVGSRWLISAVARIFRPGCQVDHTLLLEGPQGIRKSTALRTLAGDDWFTDHISELGSKDSRIELHGKWILEHSELDRVKRGELERIKAFLTARIDNFRPPYGRRAEAVPRSAVFAASVNDQNAYLTDETGNRRFWPVRCGAIDIDALTRDRDQLWAETHQRFKNGAVWWLDTSELNQLACAEQEERYQAGQWDEVILDWLANPKQRYETDGGAQLPIEPFESDSERVTVTDILLHCIAKPIDRLTQTDMNHVGRCLSHHGWVRKQARVAGRRKWFYRRPGEKL